MSAPDAAARVEALIAGPIAAMGYELVRVAILGGERRPVLQVMAERADGTMQVEDCAAISRVVSDLLDEADPIEGEYSLEVSSPGIDRPLTRPKDYERWAGFDAKVETSRPVDGRKRFAGQLLGLKDEMVVLRTAHGDVQLSLALVVKAKLVLTDALIAAAQGPVVPS